MTRLITWTRLEWEVTSQHKSGEGWRRHIIPGRRKSVSHVSWLLLATMEAKKTRAKRFIFPLLDVNCDIDPKIQRCVRKKLLQLELPPQLVPTLTSPNYIFCFLRWSAALINKWIVDVAVRSFIAATPCCHWSETRSVVAGVSDVWLTFFRNNRFVQGVPPTIPWGQLVKLYTLSLFSSTMASASCLWHTDSLNTPTMTLHEVCVESQGDKRQYFEALFLGERLHFDNKS